MHGNRRAIDARDDRFLHRDRQPLVTLLRNGNGFEFHFEPVLDSLLRPVVLAMREAGELDAAAHVDGIDRRSRQLIHPRVPPRNHCRRDERHAAANHVHGNHV